MMHKQLREMHTMGSTSREWGVDCRGCPALAGCGLLWTGWTQAAWGYRFVRHKPSFAGILVCQAGLGHVLVEGCWQPCRPGMAYLLPLGALHAYHSDRRGRWNICWVALESAGNHPLPTGQAAAAALVATDSRPFCMAIDGLQRELNGPVEPRAIQHWVELIRIHAFRILQPHPSDERLWHLWEQVDTNPAYPWTLAALSDRACLSPEHLRRLCQTHLHCSPMHHVTRLRMRRAAALLVSTSQKVASIAHATGYDSPFAFSTAFRRHLGIAPAAYRNEPAHKAVNS